MAREDIYKVARALSRDTSPSSKRLPKYPPTNILYIVILNVLPVVVLIVAESVYIRLKKSLYTIFILFFIDPRYE